MCRKRHRKEVFLHDQDVLNYVFKKKWFLLPPKWNKGPYVHICKKNEMYKRYDYVEYRNSPMLLHYADSQLKPWLNIRSLSKRQYLKFLQLSGFKEVSFTKVPLPMRIRTFISLIKFHIVDVYYIVKYLK